MIQLYKRSNTGAILIWKIRTVENKIQIKFGQLNGKLQLIEEEILIGKQKRTAEEQAEFQMKSLISSQKDKGYKSLFDLGITTEDGITYRELGEGKWGLSLEAILKETLPNESTDAKGMVLPMLAKSIVEERTKNGVVTKVEHWHRVKYPIAGEPKLDGVRCLIHSSQTQFDGFQVKSTSRKGKSYDFGTSKLRNKLTPLFLDNPKIILDGELYVHGMPQNEVSGSMRKGEYVPEIHDNMEYHVYDMVDTTLPYLERKLRLLDLNEKYKCFNLVDFITLSNREGVNAYDLEQVELGYEGIMLKPLDGKYEIDKRSWNNIKVKQFFDDEFEIIGYELGKRGSEDIVFIMKTKEGVEFKAKPMGDRELKAGYHRELHLDNLGRNPKKLLGKKATVKFKFWSHNGKPSHAQVKDIRDYE